MSIKNIVRCDICKKDVLIMIYNSIEEIIIGDINIPKNLMYDVIISDIGKNDSKVEKHICKKCIDKIV